MITGMPVRLSIALLILLGAAYRSAALLPARAVALAPPASTMPDSIRWVGDAAECHAATLQAYRLATSAVAAAVAGRQTGSWAVVLDADETVIDNFTYQLERAQQGPPYSSESWAAWVRCREITPIPGAAAFLARVRSLGDRIAIVTNRPQSECADTAAVFEGHQLAHDALLCRPDAEPSDKNPRFDAVASVRTPASATPVEIVALVGDDILLPNSMYGSWQPR